MMRSPAVLLVLVLLAPARADDAKKPDAPSKPEPTKDGGKKPEPEKPEPKKPGPKEDEKLGPEGPKLAPDLFPLSKELSEKLARFDELGEPKREAVRLVASLLSALFERDPEKLARHFHPECKMHQGHGKLDPVSPEQIRQMFEPLKERPETPLTVDKVLDLDTVRVFTREECKAGKGGMFKKDPTPVAAVMEKDDLVFLAKTKLRTWSGKTGEEEEEIFEKEMFYVLRRDGERLKVVIGE